MDLLCHDSRSGIRIGDMHMGRGGMSVAVVLNILSSN